MVGRPALNEIPITWAWKTVAFEGIVLLGWKQCRIAEGYGQGEGRVGAPLWLDKTASLQGPWEESDSQAFNLPRCALSSSVPLKSFSKVC